MSRHHFRRRISWSYALLMIGSGVQLPFLPLWLSVKGLLPSQLAFVLAGMMAVRAVANPLVSYLADRTQNRRLVTRACAGLALLSYVMMSQQSGFVGIATWALLSAFFFAPVFPLIEAFSVDGSAAHKLDYGRLRLWASLSFLSGSLLSGYLLTFLPSENAAYLMVVGFAASFVSTLVLPEDEVHKDHVETIEIDGSMWRFFLGSSFTVMIMAVAMGQSSHALLNGFSSIYYTSLNFSTFAIGLFWTFAVASEVLLFAFSNAVVKRIGVISLIMFGLGGGILRWTGMAITTNGYVFAALSVLHVVSFAMTHLGTMHFIRLSVPQRNRNTAQGLYSAVNGGVFMAAMTYASGPLYEQLQGRAFLIMAGASVVALLTAVLAVWMRGSTTLE